MKSHVLRPLYVVLGLVALVFLLRPIIVPSDFGIHESGYMYGWHRKSNEDDWKNFSAKFRTAEYCKDCHAEQYALLAASPHGRIECENCHDPAIAHPENPEKLGINRSREHCMRCHARLPYMATERRLIKGIDPDGHSPGIDCPTCHNPHSPGNSVSMHSARWPLPLPVPNAFDCGPHTLRVPRLGWLPGRQGHTGRTAS